MIDRQHPLRVVHQCQILALARSSVYAVPPPVAAAELALMRQLDALHLQHPFAGSRMLRDLLRLQGVRVGRKPVATLMRRGFLYLVAVLDWATRRVLAWRLSNSMTTDFCLDMDGRGAWRDNLFIERLWKSVTYEEVYLHGYDSVTEARHGHTLLHLLPPGPAAHGP